MHVAVVGATGQVGTVMRRLLEQRRFPVTTLRYFASPHGRVRPADRADAK